MFGFIKKIFIASIGFIGLNGYNAMKCVSMGSQECQVRPTIVNSISNEPLFILIVLMSISAVEVVMILIILVVNYVFSIKSKTLILKYSI